MSISEPEIRANMLFGLEEFVGRRNVDLPKLMTAAGLDPALKPDDSSMLPLNGYARLLELAATATKDDCFGLHFAQVFPRGGMGALGFLVLNAPDLGTCLACMRRYVRLQCEAIDFKLEEAEGIARLAIVSGPAFVAPRKQFLELVMAITMSRLGREFGDGWKPIRAEFEYREPNCGGEYEVLFGRNLTFEARETALSVKSDLLKSRNANADDRLFKTLQAMIDRTLAEFDRQQDAVWKVDAYIVGALGGIGGPSLEGAATALGRSSRQLQTELKRHNTTFEDELVRVRRALGERYLRDTDWALTEIAFLLGFSELSAFTRAARGWLGKPPSQWRQDIRRGVKPDGV